MSTDGGRCTCRHCVAIKREREIRETAHRHPGEVIPGSARQIEPRRLDQIISVRLSGAEAAFLRDKANAAGCSTSDLIREAIQKLSSATVFVEGRRVS